MLVHDGGDRVVLGRQAVWPPGRFSILAGFVEPGESAEAAVAREVAEEVGLRVTDVRYVGSQPWPFPQSLMLGFVARADGADELHPRPGRDRGGALVHPRASCCQGTGPRGAAAAGLDRAAHPSTAGSAGEFELSPAAAEHQGRPVGVVGEHDGVGQRRPGRPRRRSGRTRAAPRPARPGCAGAGRPGPSAGGRRRRRRARAPAAAPRGPAARRRPAAGVRVRGRRGPGSRSHSTGRYVPVPPGPERVQHLAGQGAGVQPVGVPGVGVGAAVLQPQRRRAGRSRSPARRRRAGRAPAAGRRASAASPSGRAAPGPSTATRSAAAPGSGRDAGEERGQPVGEGRGVSGSGRVRTGRPTRPRTACPPARAGGGAGDHVDRPVTGRRDRPVGRGPAPAASGAGDSPPRPSSTSRASSGDGAALRSARPGAATRRPRGR